MSEFGEHIGSGTVKFTRSLPGPIEKVWRYITESDMRAKWLASGEFEQHAGGSIEMDFHHVDLSSLPDGPRPEKYKDMPDHVVFSGTVTECDPPRLFSHTWEFGEENTEVRYELETQGDNVLLTLTHTRLETRDSIVSVSGGWHTHLDILADVLNEQQTQPFWQQFSVLEKEYEQRVAG